MIDLLATESVSGTWPFVALVAIVAAAIFHGLSNAGRDGNLPTSDTSIVSTAQRLETYLSEG